MSTDTKKRIGALVRDNITNDNNIILVEDYFDENLRQQGNGTYIVLAVTDIEDHLAGQNLSEKHYRETGTVVFNVYSRKGRGRRGTGVDWLSFAYDKIRDFMRNYRISGTGTQEGQLFFHTISTSDVFEVNSTRGNLPWRAMRIFLTYQKNYTV